MGVFLKRLLDDDATRDGRAAERVERDAGYERGNGPGEEDERERHDDATFLWIQLSQNRSHGREMSDENIR